MSKPNAMQQLYNDNLVETLPKLAHHLSDAILLLSWDSRVVFMNAAAESIFVKPGSDPIGLPLSGILEWQDYEALAPMVAAVNNGKGTQHIDLTKKGKTFEPIYLKVAVFATNSRAGVVTGITILAKEVISLAPPGNDPVYKEASARQLRTILETAVDFAIVTLDKDGYIIDWTSGAENMFGYTRQEALGQHTSIFFTPEDNQADIPRQEMRRAADIGYAEDERWHMHKNGSRFFMSGVMRPIIEGALTGYVKVARNITDRKLAEEALFLSEQRKNIDLQSTHMGQWDWDIASDVIVRNEYAASLLGIDKSAHDKDVQSFFCCIHPNDVPLVRRQLNLALDGLNIFQADYRVIRQDNQQPGWISSYGRIITHTDGRPSRMIGVSFDITARKNMEKQKDDFISVASHELKTPVTSIKGYSHIILQNLSEQGDNENIALLKRMNGQVDRLTKLLFTLLDTTSTLEGKLRLDIDAFDINEMIAQEINDLAITYPGHRLIWKHVPIPVIHADKARIRQVLINLVSNAAKYSPENTDIIISTEDPGDGVLVKVQDHGHGMPSEEQTKVFDRYYRGDNRPGNHQSFGLGLYISLEIIRQHNGSMGVESIKDKGSTFYFKLPYT